MEETTVAQLAGTVATVVVRLDVETTEGTATDGTATEGTATDGTATEGTATEGTATDGATADERARDTDETAVVQLVGRVTAVDEILGVERSADVVLTGTVEFRNAVGLQA